MGQRDEIVHESGTEKFRLRTTIWSSGDRFRARVSVWIDDEWVEAWTGRSRNLATARLLAARARCRLLDATLDLGHLLIALSGR